MGHDDACADGRAPRLGGWQHCGVYRSADPSAPSGSALHLPAIAVSIVLARSAAPVKPALLRVCRVHCRAWESLESAIAKASRRMSLLPLHRAKQVKSDNSFFLSNRTKSLERMTGGRCLRVRMMNRHRQRVARAPIPEVDVVYACQSAPPVSGWRRLAIRLPIYGGRCVGALCPPVHRLRYWNHASSATLCGWRLCSA